MGERNERDAVAALDRAHALGAATDRRGRTWLVRFQLAYGVMSLVVVPLVGLFPGPVGAVGSMAFWVPCLTLLLVYAARQPVSHRGMAKTHLWMMAVWTALYLGVLALGSTVFTGVAAWWAVGAVAVASPAFVAAWTTARRLA
ncbi:hypothetical protein [Actinomadura kijaniata]|uniref:hypothetical protein n=1 Tax=Actinomadura kijaniata TaxID=46161 RepID=UPI00082F1C29|nr:hypothetical protein [Actinomadura kijaniata]